MTRQEHIETVEQVIWDWMQSHYQESCYTTELGKFTNALCDFWKIYNNNKSEIERLKAENIQLTTKLGQVLLSIDTVKEMNTMCSIDEQRKQAKIDVLNELKKKKSITIWDIDELLKEYEL